jgi:hypothetical protein
MGEVASSSLVDSSQGKSELGGLQKFDSLEFFHVCQKVYLHRPPVVRAIDTD